jgi:Arc/MetJ family transcription regulator
MRTNIVLDDELVAEAMEVSGAKTKREVVDIALHELVKSAKRKGAQRRLLALRGREELLDPDYDLYEMRRNSTRDPD